MSLLLGLELSADQITISVVDRQSRRLAIATEALSFDLRRWWLHSPEMIFREFCQLLEEQIRGGLFRPAEIAAIGFVVDHGISLLDPDLKIVSPRELVWSRSSAKDRTHLPVRQAIDELREEQPRELAKLGAFLSLGDYLRFRLTGAIATTEAFATQTTWSRSWDQWNPDRLSEDRVRLDALPPIFPSCWKVGVVHEDWIKRFGFRRGTWVNSGSDPLTAHLLLAAEPAQGTRVLYLESGCYSAWEVVPKPQEASLDLVRIGNSDYCYRRLEIESWDPRGKPWVAPDGEQWTIDTRLTQRFSDWSYLPSGEVWFSWECAEPSSAAAFQAGLGLGWWPDSRRIWRKNRAPVGYGEFYRFLRESAEHPI